ncbi:MAG: YceI family protein [Chitinophagaceae bacterium]|nr:YceI family protein [Chitinophagaceae bacterium]
MKKTILSLAMVLAAGVLFAQKKTTTSAVINFDATTPIDALPKAENKTVIASLDTKSGTVAFEAAIKSFTFSNPKIQEHFNNKGWMDSDQFATATFKGSITNLKSVKFNKDGTYPVDITGDLTMHGITKTIDAKGFITVRGKLIVANSEFTVKLEDYKVNGGAIAAGKVSKEPTIKVVAEFN